MDFVLLKKSLQSIILIIAKIVFTAGGHMIKLWVMSNWLLRNMKNHNHATVMNQKVVVQNFIIEPTGDKYFSNKVVLKLKSAKNAFYKKGALKLIFFNEIFF